jgi:transcriptional regulator
VYVPPHFRQDDGDAIAALIAAAPLGTLVTTGAAGFHASHVPMMLDRDASPNGTLLFHLARANEQWRDVDPDAEAMVIFRGADAYISPSWFPTKRETGKVVPTWNYVAVHVYGPLRISEEPAHLRDLVERLTGVHEAAMPHPWEVSDAPESYVAGQLRGIVGIELPIARIEAKWKLSQNKTAADISGAVAALLASNDANARATGAEMAAALDEDP